MDPGIIGDWIEIDEVREIGSSLFDLGSGDSLFLAGGGRGLHRTAMLGQPSLRWPWLLIGIGIGAAVIAPLLYRS